MEQGASERNALAESGIGGLQELANRAASGYRSVGAMVYHVLRDAIVAGVFVPGEKLRQETLAEAIGVSRVPVRSALIQLESDGLVELKDRKGAVVRSLNAAQVAEIYNLRILLEGHALTNSMANMTVERADRLRVLADEADSELEGASFVSARKAFYVVLYDAESSPVLWELIEDLRLRVGRYILGWRVADGRGHSHRELADVVTTGNAAEALAALHDHLGHVRDGVLNMLEHEKRTHQATPS
ncbi:MAG: GntR family transcriptional regulator [Microcella sp.]|uniref:GntR family transcriptional regulator n=1 Tax=Microcella sp. TaxID=1913979 RepID=UPI0033158DDE